MIRILKNLYNNQYTFSIISKISGVIIGFLFSIAYSRYFGAELRGVAAVINNYLGMLYIFLCMGMYQAYPYYRKGLSEDEVKQYYLDFINDTTGLFLVYFAVSIIIIIFAPFETKYKITALLLPIEFLIKQFNYIVLIENPKLRNLSSIIINLIELALVGVFALFGKANYMICILFIVLKQVISAIIAICNLKINLLLVRPKLSRNILKFMKFGFLPMVSTLLMTANYKVDVLMLDSFENVSSADVGIYTLGVQLAERVWMIPDALKDILLSKLSKGKKYDEVARVIRISLPVMFFFVILIILLGQPFITFVYGAEFSSAYRITLLIMFGTICMVFYKMINSYYIVEGKRFKSFSMLAITTVVNVLLNALLIPRIGTAGAAIASLISYMLCGFMFVLTFIIETHISIIQLIIIKKEDVKLIIQKLKR